MPYPTCNHRKDDGSLCGSVALHGKKFCYYHQRDQKRQKYAATVIRRADVLGPRLPPMKSLADVQMALTEVFNALLENRIPLDRAASTLYALQQATEPFLNPRSAKE
jgi:hypothetical protein